MCIRDRVSTSGQLAPVSQLLTRQTELLSRDDTDQLRLALAQLLLSPPLQHGTARARARPPADPRGAGEPAAAADRPGASSSWCRYKTELCRPFDEHGACKYGDKCQFAHGRAELRPLPRHPKYKTDLCRTYHTTGLCPYGPRCHFIHNLSLIHI